MATQQFLAKAYLAYFGRPVDPVGAFAFKDATETEVFQAFYASPESQALYGTGFGAAQITAIYQMLFNRDPEPAGLDYWLHQVELGLLTPAGAALGILNGARNSDAVAVANKLAASDLFTTSLDTLSEVNAYVGDASAAHAREFLKSVGTLPATQGQVNTEISELMDINGPGVHGAPNTFTLTEVVAGTATVVTDPPVARVVYWGYNPHAHGETGVDNLDGNNPDGNDNNLTNEGPADGGIPLNTLLATIANIAGVDLINLGLINVTSGSDNVTGAVQISDVAGISISQNTGGTQTVTVTGTNGQVAEAEVQISDAYFGWLNSLFFDAEGNSRLYEVIQQVDINAQPISKTVTTYAPIVLTSFENNGGTVERGAEGQGPVTTPGDDLIVAGRLELLHGAYIDGGAGYNILEVDAKGTYAQPLELTRIQEVRIQNLPNVYTTAYGSGDGYLSNSTYPDLSASSGGSDNSVLDLSRATSIEKVVITEGHGTEVTQSPAADHPLGDLTVVGVRGDAVLRLEGDFTQDVNVDYSQGQNGPLNVELLLGNTSGAALNFVGNADALNLASMGTANTFDSTVTGGNIVKMNVTGTGYLEITGDLDGWFTDNSPVTIDASANTGGVDLKLLSVDEIVFVGTASADDHFVANSSARSVTIAGGNGNGEFTATAKGDVVITAGNGANEINATSSGSDVNENEDTVTVTVGNGQNDITVSSTDAFYVTAGDGANRIEASGGSSDVAGNVTENDVSTIVVGNGQNEIDATSNLLTITAGNGSNEIAATAATLTVTSGTGNDVIKATANSFGSGQAANVNAADGNNTISLTGFEKVAVTTGAGNDAVTVLGGNVQLNSADSGGTDLVGENGDETLFNLSLGTGTNTVTLGSDAPGAAVTALPGSSISGENITLKIDTNADLSRASLSGVVSVEMTDADNLTLTVEQFLAIGASKFSVLGESFGANAELNLVVSSSTSLTALGVDSLPRGIDVSFELKDGVTLTMTAQQLHERVAIEGVNLFADANGDFGSANVVITGASDTFNPFATTANYGGSLGSFFDTKNTKFEGGLNGYDRPTDAPVLNRFAVNTDTLVDGKLPGFSADVYTFLRITGEDGATFAPIKGGIDDWGQVVVAQPAISIGKTAGAGSSQAEFMIDYSSVGGEITGMVIDRFDKAAMVYGNASDSIDARLDVNLGGDVVRLNVSSYGSGLVSQGVDTYVVTSDGGTARLFYTCETTQNLKTLGIQGDVAVSFLNTERNVDFLVETEYSKANGYFADSLKASFAREGADAVVNVVAKNAVPAGQVQTVTNISFGDSTPTLNVGEFAAKTATINVVDAFDTVITTVAGVADLTMTAGADLTITNSVGDADAIDASGVVGDLVISASPENASGDSDFTFVGAEGATTLTLKTAETYSADSSFEAAGELTVVIDGAGSTNLTKADTSGIDKMVVTSGDTVVLTIAQAYAIGAADISGAGTLSLTQLGEVKFVAADFADVSTVSLGSITVIDQAVVTLHPDTDLTGVTALVVPKGVTLNLTAAQYQQLSGAGSILGEIVTGTDRTIDFTVNITDLTQADVAAGLNIDGVKAATVSVTLAESVTVPADNGSTIDTDLAPTVTAVVSGESALIKSLTFNVGDNMKLSVPDVKEFDGVNVVGGNNSTLEFTDIDNTNSGPLDTIDASGFDVDTLRVDEAYVSGQNIDNLFQGLIERVSKAIFDQNGDVVAQDQTVTIEAGTTVAGSLEINRIEDAVEIQDLIVNLNGGVKIGGALILNSTDKNDGSDLLHAHLKTLTINSTGTLGNTFDGTTANIITGQITGVGNGLDTQNNVLDVTINAEQDLQIQGGIVFTSAAGDDGYSLGDDTAAIAKVTVEGDADVSLGAIDTLDGDVDGLEVVHNGTGTLSLTVDASNDQAVNNTDALSFTGTGDIVLNTIGAVNLSDDDLAAVTAIRVSDTASSLTLSYAQLNTIGASAVTVIDGTDGGTTVGTSTLNINGYTGGAFDANALDVNFITVEITLADQDVVLDAAVDLSNVDKISVAEGRTLTLTAAQFQQLQGKGAIVGYDTNGVTETSANPFNLVISDLTQADVEKDDSATVGGSAGFSLDSVQSNAAVTVTLGEVAVTLGKVVGSTTTLASDLLVGADTKTDVTFTLTDGQTLGLVNYAQANGLKVNGTGNTTIVYKFADLGAVLASAGTQTQIDASGYDVTTLKALAAAFTIANTVNGEDNNVEFAIDDLASTVELRLYKDPAQLGFLDPTYRVVVIEAGVSTPGSLIFNDYDDATVGDEVRTLDLTLEGNAQVSGDISIPTRTGKVGGSYQYFDTLTITSEGTQANKITGSLNTAPVITAGTGNTTNTDENNLLKVVIDAQQNLVIEGDIVFNSINDVENDVVAALTVSGPANVTVQQLNVADDDIGVLNIANTGTGTLTVTGASPALFDGNDTGTGGTANLETLTFSGTGNIKFGDADGTTAPWGITAENLSTINAANLSGRLDLGTIDGIDNRDFTFTSGTGVTKLTVLGDSLDADDTAGTGLDQSGTWSFNLSNAAVGSELHLGALVLGNAGDLTAADRSNALNISLGNNATLYIDATTDLSLLDSLSITGVNSIVLADGATLTLTAAQASGLKIVAGADTSTAGITAKVNIVDLESDTATSNNVYDFSGTAADIAGTITFADGAPGAAATNDVTLDAATNLGFFSVTLKELANTSASLAGQTIRFATEAQATREIIVNEVTNDNDSSTNVVWLFNSIAAAGGIETIKYDGAIGRLWINTTLINNEGGLVESLFTTLPSSILRADFGTLSQLNVLLNSNAIDRVMEITSFNTVGNLTFNDVGLSPVEHLSSLTLQLGGQVTVGNIAVADVVGAPGYNPATISFSGITINSFRSVATGDLYATEGYVNDNDGFNESKATSDLDIVTGGDQLNAALTGNENTAPINMNTVGNLSVGADNGLDLLTVNLRTGAVTVVSIDGADGGSTAGAGAALTVGTITYETDLLGQGATLDLAGATNSDNNITIAAINTADTGITGLTIDATNFTAVLDPVMNMDNTEGLVLKNDGGAPEAGSNGTITLSEIEGNELSLVDASGFDGKVNIVLSQIDSNDDLATDLNGDTDTSDTYEGVNVAFTYTAGQGDNDVVVKAVGTNVPTLATGNTWNFDFATAGVGSTLTLDASASIAAGSNLVVALGANTALNIDGALDLSGVNLTVTGGNIVVGAGDTLTLSVGQVLALAAANVNVVGEGTIKVSGDATDKSAADLGEVLRTANVDLSLVTLDLVAPGVDADSQLDIVLLGALVDNPATPGYSPVVAAAQSVVGSPNSDDITTANDLNNTLNGMGGNDFLTGGSDLVGAPNNFNTYVVASGTDTIVGLKSGSDVSDVADVITASGATTVVNANVAGDFYATVATTNTGATVALTATDAAANTDNVIDMSEVTAGTSGFTITGSNFKTGSVHDDGNDTLIGSAKNDIINGGNWDQATATQADVLTGNGGNDRFVFNTSVSSAANLAIATTTAGIDRELLTFAADFADGANETLTIGWTVNGIADSVALNLAAIDSSILSAIVSAVVTALDQKAGIAAVAGSTAGTVLVSGDNAASVTFTTLTGTNWDVAHNLATDYDSTPAGAEADVLQVSTLTVSGTPTTGDYYSIVAALVEGGGESADATADGTPTTDEIAAGIDATFTETDVTAAAVLSVVTFTDIDGDNGGFALATDTTAAFAGSGASDNGADEFLTADVITDFVSGQDSISFGLAAGVSGANYFEAAAVATYAAALTNADNAFDGTVQYYMTSATDLDGVATTGLVDGQEGAGLLFVDANLDGNADLVVLLTGGITSANFNALDIVA